MIQSVFVDVVGNKEINQKQQNVIKKIIQHFPGMIISIFFLNCYKLECCYKKVTFKKVKYYLNSTHYQQREAPF